MAAPRSPIVRRTATDHFAELRSDQLPRQIKQPLIDPRGLVLHDAQLGLEYRCKVLRRNCRAHRMTALCNGCRGIVHSLGDLGIARLECGILYSQDM